MGLEGRAPLRGLAWYGRFLRGRPSFLSPSLLADLYPRAGRPEDFEEAKLSRDAYRIARILLRSGPQPTSALREALAVEGRKGGEAFTAALTELGRELVITHLGTEDEGAGWPSAVLELTVRAFPIPKRRNMDAANGSAPPGDSSTRCWSRAPSSSGMPSAGERREPARRSMSSRGAAKRDAKVRAIASSAGLAGSRHPEAAPAAGATEFDRAAPRGGMFGA